MPEYFRMMSLRLPSSLYERLLKASRDSEQPMSQIVIAALTDKLGDTP